MTFTFKKYIYSYIIHLLVINNYHIFIYLFIYSCIYLYIYLFTIVAIVLPMTSLGPSPKLNSTNSTVWSTSMALVRPTGAPEAAQSTPSPMFTDLKQMLTFAFENYGFNLGR